MQKSMPPAKGRVMPPTAPSPQPRLLNLGCGETYSVAPEWLNIDVRRLRSAPSNMAQYQLGLGIPFADQSFDGVYHSHILEHFPREHALPFLRECLRVLRPGGVLRVVVPNLEGLLRQYASTLDEARGGKPGAESRLLWMQVELLDQLTRNRSGGLMGPAWQLADEETAAFIRARTGGELESIPRRPEPGPLTLPEEPLRLAVPDAEFLASGETHRWMYDSVSLGMLLRQAGFANIRAVSHTQSALPEFSRETALDSAPDGSPRKPDSLYMEAMRPLAVSDVRPVSVALFCSTDSGGAAIAALRLQEGLRAAGTPAITYVQKKAGIMPHVYVLPPSGEDRVIPDGAGGALLASHPGAWKKLQRDLAPYPKRPAGSEAFSSSEAVPRLADVPLLGNVDILHPHWVAGFLDVPGNTAFLSGKKIVWTLHDMNPLTGGCHYADGCEKYRVSCGACPQLGSSDENDLSRAVWKRRSLTYPRLDITVVSPSRWLADVARQSSLMGRFRVEHIPNGLPLDVFKPYNARAVREELGIAPDQRVILFGAEVVFSRRKGFSYLKEALERLREDPAAHDITLLVLGHGGNALKDLRFPAKFLGHINSPETMALVYSAADVLALPTLEDNLPNVLLEALACGTPAVAFAVGGVPEIIDHGHTGYLARPRDAASLADGLRWALAEPEKKLLHSRLCRAKAMENYSLERQAARYTALYQELARTAPR